MVSVLTLAVAVLAAVCSCTASDLGRPVSIGEHPSLVQIEVFLPILNQWFQQCAGIVLTNYHYLSTATCFHGEFYDPAYRRIIAGSSRRSEPGEISYVHFAVNHPEFSEENYDKDVSIVRVTHAIHFGPNIQQGAIIQQGVVIPQGIFVDLLGWGTTVQGGRVSDGNLHKLELIVTNKENCREQYQGHDRVVTDHKFCAGLVRAGGRDYDNTDLGAPAFFQNALVGIVSFGKSNANDIYPVVLTSISSFTEWILQNVH
ncbi:trypsin, alkaline A-like [Bombyx mandarina]|uniref:Trypsin, alkaline A-like n=1 Tax=Bombyx mandarina TaxID=7092 RepID=A0A6J2KE95_BOMMA|nr:trypsin, alkaline A-like [Bombyx mandarina]